MDFDETGLYKGFVKNVEGQKYPGRNPEMMSLTEADEQESYENIKNIYIYVFYCTTCAKPYH